MAKYRREDRFKIAKRAISRWNKVLCGQQPGAEDISMIVVPYIDSRDDLGHKYAVQRNRHGKWDVVFFWGGLFTGRNNEERDLKDVTLEECLEYIYKTEPPLRAAGRLTRPSDLRKVAAAVNFVPSDSVTGYCAAATEQIGRLREQSLANKEKIVADRAQQVQKNIVLQSSVKALKPIRLKTA